MMFGLLIPALLAAAGVGLDFYRANVTRAALNEATDGAVLAAARAKLNNPALSLADARALARRFFDANFTNAEDFTVETFNLEESPDGASFTLTASGPKRTLLMSVFGSDEIALNAVSQVRRTAPRALEVALALDNTGSMSGQKLTDLKSAAEDLVDVLMANPASGVKIAIVPFARHVNVGVSNRYEPWMSVPADGTWNENQCTVDTVAAAAAGCSITLSTCDNDGVAYACDQWSCPGGAAVPATCTMVVHPTTWLGCVGSRGYPRNIQDTDYNLEQTPGVLNVAPWPDCPAPITPLTGVKADVTAALNAMSAGGQTYVPGGLAWAMRALSSDPPFTGGRTYAQIAAENGLKAIVLMTDGDNTASPDYSAHYGSDIALANAYTRDICDEIKSNAIALYTIAFEVPNGPTKDMLEDCATDPDYYFDATNGAALEAAFAAIAENLSELALTK